VTPNLIGHRSRISATAKDAEERRCSDQEIRNRVRLEKGLSD
jgi:hypothetical protein